MKQFPFAHPKVAEVFSAYPEEIKKKLLFLRSLIFEVAAELEGVGEIEETLRWGEPSYIPSQTKSGTTIRIDWKPIYKNEYAMYFNCKTSLLETFKARYPNDFSYRGNRSIIFNIHETVAVKPLRDCISLALTYHSLRKIANKSIS